VVDGERPLKFSLSKLRITAENSALYLYLASKDILGTPQTNRFKQRRERSWAKRDDSG
jgi:hypothetical protein